MSRKPKDTFQSHCNHGSGQSNSGHDCIHIDHAGPFIEKTFLLVVDAHSKWLEVVIVPSTSSEITIQPPPPPPKKQYLQCMASQKPLFQIMQPALQVLNSRSLYLAMVFAISHQHPTTLQPTDWPSEQSKPLRRA